MAAGRRGRVGASLTGLALREGRLAEARSEPHSPAAEPRPGTGTGAAQGLPSHNTPTTN